MSIVLGLFGSGLGLIVPDGGTEVVTNFSFYCLVAAVAYATTENVRGRVPNQVKEKNGKIKVINTSFASFICRISKRIYLDNLVYPTRL